MFLGFQIIWKKKGAPELQLQLILTFLEIYGIRMVGNLGTTILILFSSQVHTPMYYLFSRLSFIDCYQFIIITPKMLDNFVKERNAIL